MAEHTHDLASDAASAGAVRRLGDFTLLRLLGRGSQGEVWEARQESLGRLVALKLLSMQLTFSDERLQRFRREAEAGGRLSHPGIVTVYAIGEHDGVHYFAQELVAGGRTLADMIEDARRLPVLPDDWPSRVAELFAQVAEALHAAHGVGVIHRDVKPGNILITQDGRPKIADFGLALVQDELSLSHTGDLSGTPLYMSPEQVTGARAGLDHRTDIFSLGSTLYEALTLNRPFTGDRQQIMEGIVMRDPVDPRRVHRHVPRDLAVICLKALEKQPARRFATAGALAADLRRVLAGEPIHARPPGPLVRAAKWTHRHPRVSAAGSVAAISLALVTWQWLETRKANHAALDAMAKTEAANLEKQTALERATAALDEVKAAREHATTESKASEHVMSLLEDVFARADPAKLTAEESVQPPEVLDQGAALVDLLNDVPTAQWRLVMRLGCGYRNVGLYAKASAQLVRALDIATRSFGEHDYSTAQSRLELARVQRLTGDYAAAQANAQQALADQVTSKGQGSIEALIAVGELGQIAKDRGRPVEAEAHLRAYHDGCLRLAAGAPSAHAVMAGYALGVFLLEQGRLDEAERCLRPAFDHAELLPEYHALLLGEAVASLNDRLGRQAARDQRPEVAQRCDADAERLYTHVLERQRVLLGNDNDDTLTTISGLGAFYRERQQLERARPLLEEAVSHFAQRDGPLAASTLTARNNVARLEYAAGNAARAEAIWSEIIAADRSHPLADSAPVLAALSNLASLTRDDGRLEQAERYAAEAVERTPPGEPELAARQTKLANIRRGLAALQAATSRQP